MNWIGSAVNRATGWFSPLLKSAGWFDQELSQQAGARLEASGATVITSGAVDLIYTPIQNYVLQAGGGTVVTTGTGRFEYLYHVRSSARKHKAKRQRRRPLTHYALPIAGHATHVHVAGAMLGVVRTMQARRPVQHRAPAAAEMAVHRLLVSGVTEAPIRRTVEMSVRPTPYITAVPAPNMRMLLDDEDFLLLLELEDAA